MGLLDMLKPDPRRRLLRMIQAKSLQAVHTQRNGKLLEFAELTREIAALEAQLTDLERLAGTKAN